MSKLEGKPKYFCPHCGQKLSFLEGSIIKMVGRLHAENFSCKTMFYIPARLGQYGVIVGEGVRISDGALVDLECINGACKKSVTSPSDESLAEIRMVDGSGKEFVVLFNRIFGRRATFLIDMKNASLVDSFGDHAEDYTPNFDKKLNFCGS